MSPSAVETNGHAATTVVNPKVKSVEQSTGSTTSAASRYHSASSDEAIHAEHTHAAHNYHPLPIVFARAQGTSVWDPEGKQYLDFLSAYSAVNQGHCHPELVKALCDQAATLTLSSRAFYNDVFPRFAKFVTEYFGFDMVLPMNTGAEAVETSIKIARKWGYKVKGIPKNEAMVISVAENFHGRTFSAISMSTDPESRDNYGPYLPNVGSVCPATGKVMPYNDISAVKTAFEAHGDKIAAFLVEPIQGEAGIVVPDDDYLVELRKLCDKHNILLICDEIQTGIARTGKMLCFEWSGIRPDMVLLGKAISGGMYPVSAVLANRDVMLTIEPGTHGSTYGGNPLGCAVAIRALEVVKEENLVERAERLGHVFRDGIRALNSPMISIVRGKGLLNAIIIDETKTNGHSAWDLCMLLKEKGLLVGRALKIAHVRSQTSAAGAGAGAGGGGDTSSSSSSSAKSNSPSPPRDNDRKTATTSNSEVTVPPSDPKTMTLTENPTNINLSSKAKPTHENIIRLAPPLVITEDEIKRAIAIIAEALRELPDLKGEKLDEVVPPPEQNVTITIEN